jgi:hypothetical protein
MPTQTCYLFSDDGDELEVEVTYRIFPAEPDVGIFTNQVEIESTIPNFNLTREEEEDLMMQILEGEG